MIEHQQENFTRLGFLGVGWIGKNRMEALISRKLVQNVSIFDPDEKSVQKALQVVPSAKVHSSYEDLLREDLDGIVIATPSALHARQAILALEHGKAVFCQKPLGRNLAEAKKVVHKAQTADRLLGVDFSYRFTQGMQSIKSLLSQQKLGKIYAVEAVFHNAYGPDKEWFYNSSLSGGGCLIDLGSHLVDLFLFLFDAPSIEVRYANHLYNGKPVFSFGERVENFSEAQLKTSTGISIRMACSWKLSVGKDAEIFLKIYGTEGGASFHNVNGSFYDFQALIFSQNATQTLVNPPDDWGGKAIENWALRLAENNRFNHENYELIKGASLLEDIYKYTGI